MMQNAGQLVVRRHGLPPFLNTFQAATVWWDNARGQRQGGPADASAGLSKVEGTYRGQAATWAWNPVYSEWQLCHVLTNRNTLWQMGQYYYGQASVQNVHKIGDVEQNAPIIGADASGDRAYALGVPGDVLLIPGLEQPSGQPPVSPPGGSVPDPGGAQPPDTPEAGERPPNYPPDWPWPPEWSTTPVEPPNGAEPPGATPSPIGADVPATTNGKGWWTAGKIVAVAGVGATTLGLIVWGIIAASKPKKRKKSKRRR